MSNLATYLQAEQLSIDDLLAEAVKPGDLVTHLDHPTFQGQVVERVNGRCRVKVLDGWRGPLPMWPVPMPAGKLRREVVG